MHETANGLARRFVGRDALAVEKCARLGGGLLAKPACQHGRPVTLSQRFDNGLGALDRVRDGGRAIQHENGILARVGQQGAEGGGVARPVGIADNVDGIAMRPRLRQDGVERRQRLVGKFGQTAAGADKRVGGQHADAAAIGQNGQPVAGDAHVRRQGRGGVEKLRQVVDPEHAGASERGVIDSVNAAQRARVAGRGAGCGFRPSGLDDDHGFCPRGRAPRRHELPRVRDVLDIEQDRAGLAVDRQIIQRIAEIDVGHVAEGHDMGKADAAMGRPIQHGRRDRAGLGHERDVTGRRLQMGKAGIQADRRYNQADAVWPEQPQEIGLGCIQQGLFALLPALLTVRITGFAKAGGDYHGGTGSAPSQLFDDFRD